VSSSTSRSWLERRVWQRCVLTGATLSAGALALLGACRTETPDELYASGRTPTTSGGKATSGGAATAAGSGNRGGGGGNGNSEPVAGSESLSDAGDGNGGAPTMMPDPDPLGCGERPVSEAAFSRQALRAAAADCAMWHYCRAETTLTTLRDSVQAQDDDATLAPDAARAAWRAAMQAWSAVELFQFGPLGSSVESAGRDPVHGQGIRDLIYAWPAVARCKVEDQVIGRGYEQSWSTISISARGLFGLEYLLFYEGGDTICNPNGSTAKTWATFDAATLSQAKLDYASALTGDVLSHVQTLRQLWSPEGQDFRQTFIDATGYESEQQALNVVAWSLIYVEREVKDWKLGIPAGVTMNAPVTSGESTFALGSSENVRKNLQGFRALFQGCGPNGEGLGFDDWLGEAGQPDLASDMIAALDTAEAAAAGFPPLEQASPQQLQELYAAVRGLTNLLKSDFFGPGSVLNLELPAGVEGDTD
jgi:hypothetical protein